MKFKCKKKKRLKNLIKCIVKVYFWDYKKYVSLKKKSSDSFWYILCRYGVFLL